MSAKCEADEANSQNFGCNLHLFLKCSLIDSLVPDYFCTLLPVVCQTSQVKSCFTFFTNKQPEASMFCGGNLHQGPPSCCEARTEAKRSMRKKTGSYGNMLDEGNISGQKNYFKDFKYNKIHCKPGKQNFTFVQKCSHFFIILYFPIFSSILCFSR